MRSLSPAALCPAPRQSTPWAACAPTATAAAARRPPPRSTPRPASPSAAPRRRRWRRAPTGSSTTTTPPTTTAHTTTTTHTRPSCVPAQSRSSARSEVRKATARAVRCDPFGGELCYACVCVWSSLALALALSRSFFFSSGCKPFELPLLSGGLIYGYPDANYTSDWLSWLALLSLAMGLTLRR